MRKGQAGAAVLVAACVTAASAGCATERRASASTADPAAPTSVSTPAVPTEGAVPTESAVPTEGAAPTESAVPTEGAAPTGGPRSFNVVATGDVLVHDGVWLRARRDAALSGGDYDFLPALAQLQPHVVNADLAICHMEVSLGAHGAAPVGFPLFSAPPEVADAMGRMGYDSCSTASNHSLDNGVAGVERTLDAFDAAGVRHAGTARSQAEHDTPTILEVDGVKVAHLSYTYGHNKVRPSDKPWLINVLADDSIVPDAERVRAAGAQVVIVSIHWGEEFVHDPTEAQRALAQKIMDSPAVDLVIGHHAHVVQPIQQFGDRFVAYGMGNVICGASHNYGNGASREGIMPEFTFTEGPDGRFRVTKILVSPTYVDTLGGLHTTDVAAHLVAPDPGEDVARLQRARDRTAEAIYRLGVSPEIVTVR